MKYLPVVTKISYVADYVLALRFSDGTSKNVDFSGWFKGPVFDRLRSKAYFRKCFIDGGTVAWPNGADIAPETLYAAADVSTDNTRSQQTHKVSTKRRATLR